MRLFHCLQHIFVIGTATVEPDRRTASLTTRTATMLLSDKDPFSLVTKVLFTENPLSATALLCERVNAALARKLKTLVHFLSSFVYRHDMHFK